MSEMVERVAKAIYGSNGYAYEGRTVNAMGAPYGKWAEALVGARAAIEAMREPTPKMVQVVSANWGRRTWAEYNEVIDAALQD